MRKLLAVFMSLLAFIATPTFAAGSTFSVSGWTAQAGQLERFTISRVSGTDPGYVSFRTNDGTAKASIDYSAVVGRVYFTRGQVSRVVSPATHINPAKLGQTLNFSATISVNGVAQASAGAFIVEPPAPPPSPTTVTCPDGQVTPVGTPCPPPIPPTTKICPDGSMIPVANTCPVTPPPPPPVAAGSALALQTCKAYNNDDSLVIGRIYTVVGFAGLVEPGATPPPAGTTDIIILNDATHKGDGWFGLYVPISCVTVG